MSTITQKSNALAPSDGLFGWYDGTSNYIAFGWTGGTTTLDRLVKSVNDCVSFTNLTAMPFAAHTVASCVVGADAYIVGGDIYSPTNYGDFEHGSYKVTNGVVTQISADCGIGDNCSGGLVYHNSAFYLVGGQSTTSRASAIHTVMKSVDNCATFNTIVADTRTIGFKGGVLWGGVVSYKGLIWKIGGSVYDSDVANRENDKRIWSSPDGINWTMRGILRCTGRHYSQLVVHNDKIWILNGYNASYGGNLPDIWTIELLHGTKIVQTRITDSGYSARHAMSAWSDGNEIFVAGGTGSSALGEVWSIL